MPYANRPPHVLAMTAVQIVKSLNGLGLKSKKVNLPHGPDSFAAQPRRSISAKPPSSL